MPGILLTYNRHERSKKIARFRTEFIRQSAWPVFVGAGSLLSSDPVAPGGAPKPADRIRALLLDVPAVLFLVGPQGLDPERPGDLFTVRAAVNMGRPVIAVLADGARLTPEFSELPVITLTPDNLEAAVEDAARMIRLLGPSASFDDHDDSIRTRRREKRKPVEILDQEEIDALLQGVSSGEEDPADYGDLGGLQDAATASSTDSAQAVAFAAYLPERFDRKYRQYMYVYAHLADDPEVADAVERDVERFRQELGGELPDVRRARHRARLREDTRVTVVPECDELIFDPPELTKRWRGPYSRFEFEVLLPKPDQADELALSDENEKLRRLPEPGEIALVRISIQVAGIEIAHINCAAEFTIEHDNPLAAAKAARAGQARAYQKIFISYSRRDFEVTRSYQAAQRALGNDIFLDSENIRSGADWRAALAQAIDAADVMQLFWSRHSARSANVEHEWRYALKHRCPADRCATFIRPVYWRAPPPEIPDELAHLHFRMVDLEAR